MPVIIGTTFLNRLPVYAVLFVLYFYLELTTEFIATCVAKLTESGNNLIVYYIHVPLSAMVLSFAYGQFLGKRVIIYSISGLIASIAVLEAFFLGTETFNSWSYTAYTVSVALVALYAAYKMAVGEADPAFNLFNVGMLCYMMCAMVVFFSGRYLQSADVKLMAKLFEVHHIVNSVINIYFGYVLWKLQRSYSLVQ